jgi:hypothetical protein
MDGLDLNQDTYNDFYKCITSLQGLSVMAIIFTHWALSVLIPKEDIWFVICYIGEFGFVIFLFLSGFLLNMKKTLTANQDQSWGRWYKRRLIRIYPGFILATYMTITYRCIMYQNVRSLLFINRDLIHISGFQSLPVNPQFYYVNYIHWFITLIIFCYLLFPLFHFLIKKNFKIALLSSIILYIIYVIFYEPFVKISSKLADSIFAQDLNLFTYNLFFPNFFVFFFGMILGYWIGESKMKNIEILRNSKVQLLSIILLIILGHLYIYILILDEYIIARFIFYPSIGIVLVFFGISTFKNKNRFNRTLNFPGKHSYALILVQAIPLEINFLYIVYNLKLNIIDFWYISLPLIFGTSFLLALPVTYFGDFIETHKKYHYCLIILVISFIIYAAISLPLILFRRIFLDTLPALILYLPILITIILIFKKYDMKKRIINEEPNSKN